MREAAREAGALFLADGDIPHAWPYFRAIGDRETIASAIESTGHLEQPGEQIDAIIDIALGERVHPPKGLELVIAQHGICRAITYFEQFPDLERREACLILLVRTLHAELVANLKHAIERREGRAPDTNCIPELIARPRLAVRRVRRVCRHLARDQRDSVRGGFSRTGRRSGWRWSCATTACICLRQFKMRGEPPFEDIYQRPFDLPARDYWAKIWMPRSNISKRRSLLKHDPLRAIQSAQVLVGLLVRRERYQEAMQISLEHLSGIAPGPSWPCPTLVSALPTCGRFRDG